MRNCEDTCGVVIVKTQVVREFGRHKGFGDSEECRGDLVVAGYERQKVGGFGNGRSLGSEKHCWLEGSGSGVYAPSLTPPYFC